MSVKVIRRVRERFTFSTSLRSGITERSLTPPAELPLRPLPNFDQGLVGGAMGGVSTTVSEASLCRLGLGWGLTPLEKGPAWIS